MLFIKIRKGLFAGFRVRQWIGYDHLVQNFKFIKSLLAIFTKKSIPKESLPIAESFEACMQRFGMGEKDLQQRMMVAKRITAIYALLGLIAFCYALYIGIDGFWLIAFVSFMVALLFLGYAFRENFNYFQMTQRRLGCTYKEWWVWVSSRGRNK